ncbi:hypothetical protein B0H16DRAFT_1691951 [Mycena metata]|uniref:Uncharacterized protein n=1 Tax=Mycena metata TaxID=1033252 RepID=A0AAD7ITR6_9AGAR|nr:hypothetical protein B0H16DRAFT_1691951 [Mycena metata]
MSIDPHTQFMPPERKWTPPVDHHETLGQFDLTVHSTTGINNHVLVAAAQLPEDWPFSLNMNSGKPLLVAIEKHHIGGTRHLNIMKSRKPGEVLRGPNTRKCQPAKVGVLACTMCLEAASSMPQAHRPLITAFYDVLIAHVGMRVESDNDRRTQKLGAPTAMLAVGLAPKEAVTRLFDPAIRDLEIRRATGISLGTSNRHRPGSLSEWFFTRPIVQTTASSANHLGTASKKELYYYDYRFHLKLSEHCSEPSNLPVSPKSICRRKLIYSRNQRVEGQELERIEGSQPNMIHDLPYLPRSLQRLVQIHSPLGPASCSFACLLPHEEEPHLYRILVAHLINCLCKYPYLEPFLSTLI